MADLKPCPFCGGKAIFGCEFGLTRMHYYGGCGSCGARGQSFAEDEGGKTSADAAWNTRTDGVTGAPAPAPEEATTDQLLQLAGALEQRRGLAIVEAVTALSAGYHEGAFRAGYESACEEITLRLRTEVWENCLPPVDAPKDGAGEVKRG